MNKENYFSEAAMKDNPKKKIRLEIRDNSVTEKKIAENAVTTDKIFDGAVTKDKLSPELLEENMVERITEEEITEIVGEKGDIK